ncbi:MAG: tRNA lysidine(34) synthetase TilS [Opitutae bacterium]|nr:tRNA lysidine(34) synthetase TilS [Opitutae bacterium]
MSKPDSRNSNIQQKALDLFHLYPHSKWHTQSVDVLKSEHASEILIACSGGADSVFALLLTFAAFPNARNRMSVIHFNHLLRGQESHDDQNFVKKLSAELKLKFLTKNSRNPHKTDEGTLRNERRDFFNSIISPTKSGILIQGHNLDDVAETLLWRIPRGVGVEGLCSPRPITKLGEHTLLRPFINQSREEIRNALRDVNIQWRQDGSNASDQYLRNRLRKNTLKCWKSDSDRDLLSGVKRTRELLGEQDYALKQWAEEAYSNSQNNGVLIITKLLPYPKAVLRKVLTFWLSRNSKSKITQQSHVDLIIKSLNRGEDLTLDISRGLQVQISKGTVALKVNPSKPGDWGISHLPYNSMVQLPCGFTLSVKLMKLDSALIKNIRQRNIDQDAECFIPISKIESSLFFRQRLPGDKFQPKGLKGSKKVKDCMIDRHWSKTKKANTPIITDLSKKILWIPGFPPDQSSLVDGTETEVIRLTYSQSNTL